jgi:hypothetical protein
MTIAAVAVVALLMAAGARGKSGTERQVAVYLDNSIVVPFLVRGQAERLASKMFAGIGVTLNFRSAPKASETEVIVIEFVDITPARLLPGAWADARTYEGVHIRVFWDRLRLPRCSPQLLAHVMVHEITHILQGVARHSAEGIMNLRWTDEERSALERKPLGFTEADVDLIHRGMDARGARAPQSTGCHGTRNQGSSSNCQSGLIGNSKGR